MKQTVYSVVSIKDLRELLAAAERVSELHGASKNESDCLILGFHLVPQHAGQVTLKNIRAAGSTRHFQPYLKDQNLTTTVEHSTTVVENTPQGVQRLLAEALTKVLPLAQCVADDGATRDSKSCEVAAEVLAQWKGRE